MRSIGCPAAFTVNCQINENKKTRTFPKKSTFILKKDTVHRRTLMLLYYKKAYQNYRKGISKNVRCLDWAYLEQDSKLYCRL